jgi:hypothetical protein
MDMFLPIPSHCITFNLSLALQAEALAMRLVRLSK